MNGTHITPSPRRTVAIVTATDLSEASAAALRTAAALATDRGEELVIFHCVEANEQSRTWQGLLESDDDLPDRLWQSGTNHLQSFVDEHLPRDQRPRAYRLRVEVDDVIDGLERTVRDTDTSLVVVGATGHGRLQQFLLGSTAESTVRRLDPPVLVVPDDVAQPPFDHILAPVDLTRCSERSLQLAGHLAHRADSKLTILHAYIPPVSEPTFVPSEISVDDYEGYERQKRRELQSFVDNADLEHPPDRLVVRPGTPHQTILTYADDHDVDLIAMGTHGRGRVKRFFLGSTAVKVLRRIPCTTMTLRLPVD